MRKIRGSLLFILGLLPMVTVSAQASDTNATDARGEDSILNYGDAVIYGLVEGVTEFLPVSSTGHLILIKELIAETNGKEGENALKTYLLVIQVGAILAVGILYWPQVFSMMLGVFGLDPRGRALARNLALAFLPAAILGLLIGKQIKELLFSPLPVAAALAAGALLMFWAERMRKNRESTETSGVSSNLEQMRPGSALFIGLLQCFAMWPGTSRSMMTIVGGYLVGLRPVKAAEFSFLLGLVTLTAVAGYEVVWDGEEMSKHLELGPIFVGCLAAGISAALAVRWLVGYLTRRGLGLFAWYRLALAALVLILA